MENIKKKSVKKEYPKDLAPYIVEFGAGDQVNPYITYAGLLYLLTKYEKENETKISMITDAVILTNENTDMLEMYKLWNTSPLFVAKVVNSDNKILATGYGDANESNSGMVKLHKIRLAETRAKARALRELLRVEYVALDEIEQGVVNKKVGNEKERASIKEVYESLSKRIDEADTEFKLKKLGEDIRKQKEMGLIDSEATAELAERFSNKLLEVKGDGEQE